jgi:hypothetical protein
MNFLFYLCIFLFSSVAFSDLPENDLWQYDDVNFLSQITEADFNDAIKEVYELYAPIAKDLGFTLKIDGDWNDSTVNAYTQRNRKEWYIAMFGGLARRPEMTIDGFKLVICHELGHQMGGYPSSGWASYEGQADYIATHVCGRKLFSKSENAEIKVSRYCDGFPEKADQVVCSRLLDAGQSLANLLASLRDRPYPQYNTPDTVVVRRTQSAHPNAQCRLDTYKAGAVCIKPWDDKVIPRDSTAVCSNRPRCWYKQ